MGRVRVGDAQERIHRLTDTTYAPSTGRRPGRGGHPRPVSGRFGGSGQGTQGDHGLVLRPQDLLALREVPRGHRRGLVTTTGRSQLGREPGPVLQQVGYPINDAISGGVNLEYQISLPLLVSLVLYIGIGWIRPEATPERDAVLAAVNSDGPGAVGVALPEPAPSEDAAALGGNV
jgi:hypothetical protein